MLCVCTLSHPSPSPQVIWEEPKTNNLHRLSLDLFPLLWHFDSKKNDTRIALIDSQKAFLVNLDTDPSVQSRDIYVYWGGKNIYSVIDVVTEIDPKERFLLSQWIVQK